MTWAAWYHLLSCGSDSSTQEALLSAIKLGANRWNQYADWPSLLAAGQRVERLGYDTLWT